MALPAQVRTGNLVGHYQVLCQVGAGGMGVVFKAFDQQLQRTVALKFLSPDLNCSRADRDRLLREARAASALDHPNIATIHAVEETDDGQLFLVMAYYEGESLASRLQQAPFSTAEAVEIVRQIAAGLEHAHFHDLVHRDIKPSNVILTPEGVAKIVDFGLARFVSTLAPTQSLGLAGTLAYMSPEQLSGKAVDARTDIWSLGVIAYQLLTNQLPFPGENPASTIDAILHTPPADLGHLPRELQSMVKRALFKNAEDRYPSCAELLQHLETIQTQLGRAPAGVSRHEVIHRVPLVFPARTLKQRARTDWHRWVAVAAVALLAGTLGLSAWQRIRATQGGQRSANPAAYESYLHGLESLQRYDKPENLEAAIQSFQGATQADPRFALGFAALGEAYWDKYQMDGSSQWLDLASAASKRAAELNDQLSAVYITLGRIHDGTGQRGLALQEFQRALELDHRNADALLGLADTYAHAGRSQDAEATYKRAAAMRPEYWDGHYQLGAFYFEQGRFADAANQFSRVLELLPDHARAHASLGLAKLSLREEGEAEAELRKSLALAPSYAAYANLGVLFYNQRRFAESAAMTEKALRVNDKDYRLWNNLAIAREWLGQADLAKQAFDRELTQLEETVRLHAEDAQVQANLGVMYSQRRLRKKALLHMEAAMALSPDDADVLGKVGEAYENLGERSKGLECLRRALARGWRLVDLELNPDLRSLLADAETRRALGAALPAATKPPTSATH
jgi:tetratricopeptide (TPR) repeat protein